MLLAAEVPGIDVVVGGHSHTVLTSPIMANGRTPVVQAGHNGGYLGELTVTIDGDALTVDAVRPIRSTTPFWVMPQSPRSSRGSRNA